MPDPTLYKNSGFHSLSNFACGTGLLEECAPLTFSRWIRIFVSCFLFLSIGSTVKLANNVFPPFSSIESILK